MIATRTTIIYAPYGFIKPTVQEKAIHAGAYCRDASRSRDISATIDDRPARLLIKSRDIR
jgi:hypothetical protein